MDPSSPAKKAAKSTVDGARRVVTPLSRLPQAAASLGGSILAVCTHAVASLRPAHKPLHPDGELLTGRIFRGGSEEKVGLAWLDEPGENDVEVRLSRAIGLPSALPDIHGLAVRVHLEGVGTDSVGDLLFATTGWGRVTRFILTMSRQPRSRPLTTLLPYDTDSGPLLLAAEGLGPDTYELSWARPAGDWHRYGVLRLTQRHDGPEVTFDPVLNQIPGLRQYPAVRRLREPAYLRARRTRADHTDPSEHPTEENPHVH